ncbi:MAG: hypothetical protein U1G07_02085 [Verrucomicrobiota bacterium]
MLLRRTVARHAARTYSTYTVPLEAGWELICGVGFAARWKPPAPG